jgi:hypothetical protein
MFNLLVHKVKSEGLNGDMKLTAPFLILFWKQRGVQPKPSITHKLRLVGTHASVMTHHTQRNHKALSDTRFPSADYCSKKFWDLFYLLIYDYIWNNVEK